MTPTLQWLHEQVHSTAEYPGSNTPQFPNSQNYCMVGLAGEVGEAMNQWKKFLRHDQNTGGSSGVLSLQHKEKILKELRGALWYLTQSFRTLGTSIDHEAELLITELRSRSERGVIKGSGDDR